MSEVIFSYLTTLTTIECRKNERFKDILEKFKSKVNINLSKHIYLYNGLRITNHNLTFDQIANSLDKINKKITVLVMSYEEESQINNENNNNLNDKVFLNKKRKGAQSPTIEELSSIIFNLQKEIRELKESNNNSIKELKEEIKSIKKELEIYKRNNAKNEMDLEVFNINNNVNNQNLPNNLVGNMPNYLNHNMIFIRGMILAWCGNLYNIPQNWAICNGENGTPDLRNRFIMGIDNMNEFGEKGGASYIELKKHNLPPIGCGYISSDSHNGTWHHNTNGIIKFQSQYSVSVKNGAYDDWGSNWKIDLNEGMESFPINIINPYYTLFYIMKL